VKSRREKSNLLHELLLDPRGTALEFLRRASDRLRRHAYNFERNGERALIEKIAKLNPRTVFDVGANVGHWSAAAGGLLTNVQIHCFELSPSTFVTLSERLTGPGFILNNCGMSNHDGVVEFKNYGENSTISTLLTQATFHDERVIPTVAEARVVTGDTYCRENGIDHIDLLKIDVEGADHLVLFGFGGLLAKRAVRVVQFEYGYTHGDAHFLMRDFYSLFEGYGYVVGRLNARGVHVTPWKYSLNDFTSGPNFVAIHRDDAIALKLLSADSRGT
jgi:FkbM family methyltransferase